VIAFKALIPVTVVLAFVCGPLTKPKAEDLIGSYTITDTAREYLKKKGYKSISGHISIIVENGGGMRLENIPDCVFNDFGQAKGTFVTRTAKWDCCQEPNIWTRLEGLTFWIEIAGMNAKFGLRRIGGIKPPYSLHFLVGDPDNNEKLLFEKKSHRV
jgi:hypothetical protein